MDLATHQRKLLNLFRSTYQADEEEDDYMRRVAQSKDLEEGRRNIFLWRLWVLERTAVLTSTLLKRRGILTETVGSFITRQNISPFRETQAPAFLEAMSTHVDSLVASVAQFELALLKIKSGDPNDYVIRWSVDPHAILNSLAKDLPLAVSPEHALYEIHVSREFPSQFKIVSLSPN